MAGKKLQNPHFQNDQPDEGRRNFLKQSSIITALAVAPPSFVKAAAAELDEQAAAYFEQVPVTIEINGTVHKLSIEPRVTLLDLLREQLALPGTKKGCDHGQCGACTVHVDGVATRSCSLPISAVTSEQKIVTIEGLSPDTSHPLQKAWLELDVPQCGYCQTGQIMAAAALLQANPDPSDEDIVAEMTNICRCGTYNRIKAAIKLAASENRG